MTHTAKSITILPGSSDQSASYFSTTFCCMSQEGKVYIALQSFTSTSSKY
jgi:hypothetical protein